MPEDLESGPVGEERTREHRVASYQAALDIMFTQLREMDAQLAAMSRKKNGEEYEELKGKRRWHLLTILKIEKIIHDLRMGKPLAKINM